MRVARSWPPFGRERVVFGKQISALITGQEMQPYRLASTVKPSAFLRLFPR